MDSIILRSTLAWSLTAAVSCTGLTVVGVSDEPVISTQTQRVATEIGPVRGELLQPYGPALGDIDGDGFDDFILGGSPVVAEGSWENPGSTAYLFYGRPAFDAQLVSSDADATFESGTNYMGYSLGDVNGDGLQDFALSHRDGYEIIFGRKERFSGHHAKLSTGPVVTHAVEIDQQGLAINALDRLDKLGDLNGDGFDDFLVRVVEPDAVAGNVYGYGLYDYIVEGRADDWPTGEWSASLAAASFGTYNIPDTKVFGRLTVWTGGRDIDGDGYADLLAMDHDSTLLFYGRPAGLHGELLPERADADLDFGSINSPFAIGDLDGDGAADLAILYETKLDLVYGKRFQGHVTPERDLRFTGRGYYNNVLLGDTNGDGKQDLLFVAHAGDEPFDIDKTPFDLSPQVFEVRGTGERLTGDNPRDEQLFQAVGYDLPEVLQGGGYNVSPGGDLDGDGSTDLVVGAPGQQDPADSVIYLLPGAPNTPYRLPLMAARRQ